MVTYTVGEQWIIFRNPVCFYSPIGEIFRARLRQFPSLVNCCTIDWFSAWPEEALRSVASTFLGEIPELDESSAMEGLVCPNQHT